MCKNILWLLAGVMLCALIIGIGSLRVIDVDTAPVDEKVDAIQFTTDGFIASVDQITANTEKEVVVIREEMRRKIRALDPDELALAALNEIRIFREYAGSPVDQSSARLRND